MDTQIIVEAPRTLDAYIHLGNACVNLEEYNSCMLILTYNYQF